MLTWKTILIISIISILGCITPLYAGDEVAGQDTNNDNVFTLGEVVVTAERSVATTSTTVTELSENDIVARGEETAAQALEQLPGVDVQTGGKGQSYVSIRGFDQRDLKVLIDGVPAYEAYEGLIDLSMIPTESISKITVTKGASSVLYGANTMGGVVNIITKKGGKEPVSEVTASFGNNGARDFLTNLGGSSGNINYWLTYGYRTSDGFRLSDDFNPSDPDVGIGTAYNEDGEVRDLSDYIKRTINAKVGYDPNEDTSLYLSFDYHNNERGVPTESSRYWAFTKWDQWQLNLVGEHAFTDTLKIKARAFYVKHDDTLTDVSWDEDHTTNPKQKWFETSSYDDYSQGAEIQGFLNLGKWADLSIGLNYLKDDHKQQDYYDAIAAAANTTKKYTAQVGFQPEKEYSADTYTFAVEDEIMPVDRLSVVLGVSFDRFKPVKTYDQPVPGTISEFNPQIGATYDINNNSSLHASIGKKTRFPHLKELYGTVVGGNPDLDPEKALSYELGASHTFTKQITGSISCFYNDISDLIVSLKDANKNKYYANVNKASTKGIETDLSVQIMDGFSGTINYTYMSTKDDSNGGRELEGKPKQRLNLDLRYQAPFGFTANLQSSYTSGEYWEDNNYKWVKLDSFNLINVKITQDVTRFLIKNSELFLQVNNFTDHNYYETNGPEPGRSFMAGLTVRY